MNIIRTTVLAALAILSCSQTTSAAIPEIRPDSKNRGIASLVFANANHGRNYIDKDRYLGNLFLKYDCGGKSYSVDLSETESRVIPSGRGELRFEWIIPGNITLQQKFLPSDNRLDWDISISNKGKEDVEITDLSFSVPMARRNEKLPARENLTDHIFINGNSSHIYWLPFHGQGNVLLMTMKGGTALEYKQLGGKFFIHSKTSVDRENDTWRFESTSETVRPGKTYNLGFKLTLVDNYENLREKLYQEGNVVAKIAPGMVVSTEMDVRCALRSKDKINSVEIEFPEETSVRRTGRSKDKYIYDLRFSRLGENMMTVNYGNGKKAYLNFYVTEPLEDVIKKRAKFIATHQQHRDTTKWYDGLYSIWDMKNRVLLSPDSIGELPYPYMVGGSDDPTNCKPLYLSEKNVAFPDSAEIASLEYYEKNFVWGKLQRTDKELPYPYGIYGIDNWHELRSGELGDFNSGGSGKERMWRTYDYPTHFATYYNLYKIAKNDPSAVSYLDADGYLERAYQTALAYFIVPNNIFMGQQFAIKGWSDWAYKIGNFHERYILDIMDTLREEGREDAAENLRKEWEKKVLYMIYDNPWPFGSEMFVDRTAYESSYYVAEYAKYNPITPQEQLWYDKNEQKWRTYKSLDPARIDIFMKNQLDGNLAIRGLYEYDFGHIGSAWASGMDYMSQMAGAALLDYGFRFSDKPQDYINWGYNSLLSSWALVNTGTEENGFGYWFKGKDNDGAVGWVHSPYQHSTLWGLPTVKSNRGPLRYDGEIDHGLTGGVHSAGIYLVDDSDL